MVKFDWIMLFAFLLLFFSLSFILVQYYTSHVNKCVQNPLGYYSDSIKEQYGNQFNVSGYALITDGEHIFLKEFGISNKSNINK